LTSAYSFVSRVVKKRKHPYLFTKEYKGKI